MSNESYEDNNKSLSTSKRLKRRTKRSKLPQLVMATGSTPLSPNPSECQEISGSWMNLSTHHEAKGEYRLALKCRVDKTAVT